MATIDEIRKANIDKVNNIMNRFESPKEDSTLEMSEEQFNKAIETGEFSEVYTDGGLNKFGVEIRRRYAAGKLSNDDLEKAKKDLSKLIKVYKVDSTGKRNAYWVKRGEEPKGSERETSMKELWWKLNKEEKNEYLTVSRSKDSKKIADFKKRMDEKYGEKKTKEPKKESFDLKADVEKKVDDVEAEGAGDPKIRKKEKQFIQAVQELGYSEIDAKRFIRTKNFHGDEVRILGIKGNGLLFGFNYYDNYEWQYQAWDYKGQDASSDDTWMNINKSDAQKAYKKFETQDILVKSSVLYGKLRTKK